MPDESSNYLQQVTDQVGVMLPKDFVQLSQRDYNRVVEVKGSNVFIPYMLV